MIDITEGDILLDGQSVRERRPAELRREIGYAIQQVGLFPHLTVGGQHRDRAAAARLGPRAHPRARGRAARAGEPRPGRDARPLPGPALGRPAPAGGRGAGAGGRPAADADGRALRRHRPDQPRAPPERVPAPPARDPQDGRLRDPRHRRGDQDGRQDRGAAEGRQARPVRAARRAAHAPGERVRRGLRGRRPGAQAARAPARARHGPVDRRRSCASASRRPRRAPSSPTPRSPIPLLVDDEGRPLGWLSERALQGERVATSCARGPSRCSRWTTSCATRSPTCSPRRRSTGRWWTSAARVAGVLSIEILSHALKADPEEVPSGADAL